MQPHTELGGGEEPPEQFLWRLSEVEGQVRQGVQELRGVRRHPAGLRSVGGVQIGELSEGVLPPSVKVVVRLPKTCRERITGLTLLGLTKDVLLALGEISESALPLLSLSLSLPRLAVVHRREIGREQLSPVRPEDAVGVESGHDFENGVLTDVPGFGVPRVGLGPTAVVRPGPAHVVHGPVAPIAGHTTPASTLDHPAQDVGTPGLRMSVWLIAVPGAALGLPTGGELVEHPLRDERLVNRLLRPHPQDGIIDLSVLGPCGPAIEDLVAGVLRVAQDVAHGRLAPRPTRSGPPTGRFRNRVEVWIGVEPVDNCRIAKVFVVTPMGDFSNGPRPGSVRLQPRLRRAPLGLHGVGMPVTLGGVPVRRLADVPALAYVGAQPAPRGLQGVVHLVLGHRLIDPPLQDLLSPSPIELDRLVPRKKRHPCPLQLTLDREVLEHTPCHPRGALADHHIEPAIAVRGFGQQISDTAVSGDRDIESLVARLTTSGIQLQAPGLDVIEVAVDGPGFRQRLLATLQLAHQRQPRILTLLGGRPADPSDPDFSP
nr:hypothetical protein [Streptomyces sp. MK37H]